MEKQFVYAAIAVMVAASCFASGYYIGAMVNVEDTDPQGPRIPLVEESWSADSFFPPDTYSMTHSLKVDADASGLVVLYNVELPSALIEEVPLPGTEIVFEPTITFRLRDPTNKIIFNITLNETDDGFQIITDPSPGLWTLRVEAKGYGADEFGVDFRDGYSLTVVEL